MNRYTAIALNLAAVFLIIMAVAVDSPSLFYMASAIIVTLLASRIQAWLAVRFLRFERFAPPAVQVGEPVTVEIIVWSERELKRPLVSVIDALPGRMRPKDLTRSLPVAPSYDQPIKTRYTFRPTRRGRYRWERLTVVGTDALGLVSLKKEYQTEPAELVVYPAPMPVHAEIVPRVGWGASDIDSGRHHGAGLDPRGVREFATGDPLRYIHWRSSARRGRLMVKEFETGSGVALNLVLQREAGSDIGDAETSTFEAMCSHALFLASDFSKKGAIVVFPSLETQQAADVHPEERIRDVRELLTEIQPDQTASVATEIQQLRVQLPEGATVVLFLSRQDDQLPDVISHWPDAHVVCLLYDAGEFTEKPLPSDFRRVCEPSYIDRLEQAGATVHTLSRKDVVS